MMLHKLTSPMLNAHMDPPLALRARIALLIFLYFELGYQSSPSIGTLSTVDMTTWLDLAIPKIPYFITFYTLGYILPIIPCFLVKPRDHFVAGTLGYFGILTTSFILFRALPFPLEKDLADGVGFFSSWMLFQQELDTNVNNFPSLHVSLNVFALLMLKNHHKTAFLLCIPLTVGVTLSTLAVKQHYVVDILGGILLAMVFYRFHIKWLPLGHLLITPYFTNRSVSTQYAYNQATKTG